MTDAEVYNGCQAKLVYFDKNKGSPEINLTFIKQGRIHGSISRVRVGRGSVIVGQGQ